MGTYAIEIGWRRLKKWAAARPVHDWPPKWWRKALKFFRKRTLADHFNAGHLTLLGEIARQMPADLRPATARWLAASENNKTLARFAETDRHLFQALMTPPVLLVLAQSDNFSAHRLVHKMFESPYPTACEVTIGLLAQLMECDPIGKAWFDEILAREGPFGAYGTILGEIAWVQLK